MWHLLRPGLAHVLALRKLRAHYVAMAPGQAHTPMAFCSAALGQLAIKYEVAESDLRGVPGTGPLVAVANHPFGGIDGLILLDLLWRVRPDVKILGNHWLQRLPVLGDTVLAIDPFGGGNARTRNLAGLRHALAWLRSGGALAVFPAGEVAHLTVRNAAVTEPPWYATAAQLVRSTKATAVPVYFAGCNSTRFQVLGLVHPRIRTLLLPRELLNKRGLCLRVKLGSTISPSRSQRFRTPEELTQYLRMRTLLLRARANGEAAATGSTHMRRAPRRPVGERIRRAELAERIASLEAYRLVADQSGFDVYCAPATVMPDVLHEIGCLREVTFRDVGEGTGKELDLDRFDSSYLHLFCWERASQQIVGAYRVGLTDEIVPARGVAGLYTHTLFRYDRRLVDQFGPAIELGRSFVVKQFQRAYAPLMMLWKGIGRFIVAHPRYRILYGAVSISDEYDSMTKRLLVEFLKRHNSDDTIGRMLKPRRPVRFRRRGDEECAGLARIVHSIDEVDELVREIEADRRSIPVLVRQYLKLNARLIGFNVDPAFGDVLDGLFYVDLTTVSRSILERYMGRDGADSFLAHHGAGQSARAGTARQR